jgi:hypothetical protein
MKKGGITKLFALLNENKEINMSEFDINRPLFSFIIPYLVFLSPSVGYSQSEPSGIVNFVL